jgi:hypothetical protein
VATTRIAGRFRSAFPTLELYGIVRAVAEVARSQTPTLVTEAAWDAARAAAGYSDAPSARAICMRLADADGQPFPWRELLELVFDETRDIELTHALRTWRVEADDSLDGDDVYYALRRVAIGELEQQSLKPDEYRRERERLIASASRRRSDSVELVAQTLPTVGQIERIAGDWDKALALAELEPRQTPTKNGHANESVPIAEVLDRFADEADGWFCRRAQLLQYARERKIVMAARAQGSRWEDYIAEAAARRKARGALTRGLPPIGTWPSYGRMGEEASSDSVQEATGETVKPAYYWTLERCVEAARKYHDDPTAPGNPSQARYRAWAVGRPDAPSPSAFARYGGWKVVSKLARRAGPLPARVTIETHHDRFDRFAAERKQREAAALACLDEQGQITNRDVQALLGISEHRARHLLRGLRERSVIKLGSEHAVGRSVFYVRSGK